jgi:uncharacterized surface protein with fasciclin (FAS1) repeats
MKKLMFPALMLVFAAVLFTGTVALRPAKKDIVGVAVDAGFNTLVTAVKAADLVTTLQGKGPFTVFAPTDDAFKKLPAGTLDALLKDIPKLKKVLLYHVVAGKVDSKQVVGLKSAKTAEGQEIAIKVENGTVFINNAQVVKADVEATNGIIHVIDTVILPSDL